MMGFYTYFIQSENGRKMGPFNYARIGELAMNPMTAEQVKVMIESEVNPQFGKVVDVKVELINISPGQIYGEKNFPKKKCN